MVIKWLRLYLLGILILCAQIKVHAAIPDTITVMVYNLLYYGYNTSFCTSTNNNVDRKDINLRTIIKHTHPDVFTVNELGRGEHNANRILNQVMNHEDVLSKESDPVYSRATYTNTPNSGLVNMLYYKHDLFGLYHEAVISNVVRDINLYTLYYKDESLALGDTTFLSFIVAHLKAGSSNNDQQTRMVEIQNVMGYMAQNNIRGNLMFMGDFNMKSSYEQGYGLMTHHPNEEIRFYDPIDKPGVWIDNHEMTPYHTQSTRKETVGCFASGGMDDRFDQILVSRAIIDGSLDVHYIKDSYRTLGQDGKRLNESLIDPKNYSETEEVINALYHMSDHLPVLLDVAIGPVSTPVSQLASQPTLQMTNPISKRLDFTLSASPGPLTVMIISMFGAVVFSIDTVMQYPGQHLTFDVSTLPAGVYVLWIGRGQQTLVTEKLILY